MPTQVVKSIPAYEISPGCDRPHESDDRLLIPKLRVIAFASAITAPFPTTIHTPLPSPIRSISS